MNHFTKIVGKKGVGRELESQGLKNHLDVHDKPIQLIYKRFFMCRAHYVEHDLKHVFQLLYTFGTFERKVPVEKCSNYVCC